MAIVAPTRVQRVTVISLLAAYGFRTTNGPGQREALGRYLRSVLVGSGSSAARNNQK